MTRAAGVRAACDGHVVVPGQGGAPEARCALWWRDTPPHEGHRVGVLGRLEATDATLEALLHEACRALAEQGCTLALGPMDGDTWHTYRLVTDPGDTPPFALEPRNPPTWPALFRRAGFAPIAPAFSAATTDLRPEARVHRAVERFARAGVRIRELRPERFEQEVRHIHEVATAAFRDNLLFSPLALEDCLALYEPLRALVDPRLALIAERDGPVGFLFMVPDLEQARRGDSIDTVVLKTVAIHPDRRVAGLGTCLIGLGHERAAAAGHGRVIHALMPEGGPSTRVSAKTALPIRRYALFARSLEPVR